MEKVSSKGAQKRSKWKYFFSRNSSKIHTLVTKWTPGHPMTPKWSPLDVQCAEIVPKCLKNPSKNRSPLTTAPFCVYAFFQHGGGHGSACDIG